MKKAAALIIALVVSASFFVGAVTFSNPVAKASSSAARFENLYGTGVARTVRLDGLKISDRRWGDPNGADSEPQSIRLVFVDSYYGETLTFEFRRTPKFNGGVSSWYFELFENGMPYTEASDRYSEYTIEIVELSSGYYLVFNTSNAFRGMEIYLGPKAHLNPFVNVSHAWTWASNYVTLRHNVFTYIISFEYLSADGASWTSAAMIIDESTKAVAPEIPVVEGQTFSHWSTVSGNSLTENINQDSVFRAVYIPDEGSATLFQSRFLLSDETVYQMDVVSSDSPSLTSNQIPEFIDFVPPLYKFSGWRTKSGIWAQAATFTSDMDFYPVMVQDFSLQKVLASNTDRIVYPTGQYARTDLSRDFSNGVFVLPDEPANVARGDAFLATELHIVNRVVPWSEENPYFIITLNTKTNDFVPITNQYAASRKELVLKTERPQGQPYQLKLMYGEQELWSDAAMNVLRQPENKTDWKQNSFSFKLAVVDTNIRWEMWFTTDIGTRYEWGIVSEGYQFDTSTADYFLGLSDLHFPEWKRTYVHSWTEDNPYAPLFPVHLSFDLPLELPTIRMSGRHALGNSLTLRTFEVQFMGRNSALLGTATVWGGSRLSADQIPTPPEIEGLIFMRWINIDAQLTLTSFISFDTVFWAAYAEDPDIPQPPKPPDADDNKGGGGLAPGDPSGLEGWQLFLIIAIVAAGIVGVGVLVYVIRRLMKK